ncbi:LysR family transcriptional regulator [Advenella kashmirensis WT001]|uniref:LysR family transcriptional regulator n=1 Tax=Advenella kashmirensis (strain DSM 17095 / LMG 22695 / WT001) TaxID=1036672 RepID=I3UFF0_ADVKW|nr:LysR family transcriptional regulator [Advenella kashmirensis]AFK63738.1 LysR family transcriptional regulator [Advenella kashmirensis WT001]
MDMKLLAVFDEIYKTRSVSRAGENLGIPQTSVSLALARLRRRFNDQLFVRTGNGMMPTPRAAMLVPQLRQALQLLQLATQQQAEFDPASSYRTFRISMTDISHLEFMPAMMNKVARVAPNVQIEVLRIKADTGKLLESGDADLAIGYMPELEAGFYQQKLFKDGFACVVRRDHPRIDARLTQSRFKSERHVVLIAPGTGNEIVERELKRQGTQRKVALSLPTLPGVGNLLANTDLMATLPGRVAKILVNIAHVKALAPPYRFPDFSIKQHWHERYHQDPGNRWLRSTVAELFLEI